MKNDVIHVDESILFLLKPKGQICYLEYDWTLRQGLEKMRYYGYTALPVINKNGHYAGAVTEGDFLWHMLEEEKFSMQSQEQYHISDIINPDLYPAISASADVNKLIEKIFNQNFVPVVDDLGIFMGIITRQDVLQYLVNKNKQI